MKKKAKKVTKKSTKKISKKITIVQKIAKFKKENEKLKDKLLVDGKKLFKEAVRHVFKTYKNLEKFSWNQYTPHWNDGDECSFSCYFDGLAINEECEGEENESTWTLKELYDLLRNKEKEETRIVLELSDKKNKQEWEIERLKSNLESIKTRKLEEVEEKYKVKNAVVELLSNIDESVYQDLFGEGTIIINRDGEETIEECEHD
jgi:hypothetical protein